MRNAAGTEPATESVLPFAPVDELGCHVDKPAEPNNVHLEVVLDGHLDPAGLRAAVDATLAAHPLARARRGRWRGWHRRLNWEIAGVPDVPPVDHVRWGTEEELTRHRQSLLDSAPPLELAPPLRVRHAAGPDGDVVILNVHHAAMDGLSCLRLLRSIARRYAGLPDAVGADPLAVRVPPGGPGTPGDGGAKARIPRRATRIAVDSADRGPGCGFHLLSVPAGTVRSGSTKVAATVNDVLIAALVLAIEEWNGTHGREAGTIRIAMPINARATAGADEPLGNLSRLAVVASEPAHRRSAGALLTEIARQTTAAKSLGGPQIDLVSRLFATPWLPVAVKAGLLAVAQRLVGPAIVDTSLLSNLGRIGEPPDFGPDARAAGLWFSPAVRMPAGLCVGVVTLHDRLNLCFRYRRELLDSRTAGRFAAMFRDALAALGDPRPGDI